MPTMAELIQQMKAKKSTELLPEAEARGPSTITSITGKEVEVIPASHVLSNIPAHEWTVTTPDMEDSLEYQQGWNSAEHGLGYEDNPFFDTGDNRYVEWNKGYNDYIQEQLEEKEFGHQIDEEQIWNNQKKEVVVPSSPSDEVVTVEVIDEDAFIAVVPEIILNEKQNLVRTMALAGTSLCVIGAAGTGKTTCMKKTTKDMIDNGHIPLIKDGTRHLRSGHPGIAVISFTNKAVNNIRKNVDNRIKPHTITAHKLLEFRPVKYEIEDEQTGKAKLTMRFEPSRTIDNPLPKELRCLIWEESSMVGTPLYNMVKAAMPHNHQEIFLGDIQQLPPVFGAAVLGFKMNELPVVELTDVYRQALDSPIIKLAWKILDGNPHDFSAKVIREKKKLDNGKEVPWITCPALDAMNYNDPIHGSLEFRIWQKVTTETQALLATQMMFKNWYSEGKYDPYKDIILCPYNMKYGTIEINKLIAQYFSIQRNEAVHEIVAGYEKVYYAVGDRVLVGKEDAFIESIEPNPAYLGKTSYCVPSVYLDRWGVQQTPATSEEVLQHKIEKDAVDESQAEYFLEGEGSIDDIDGDTRVNAASHIVTCRFSYSDDVVILKSAGELKPPAFLGGYCLTVHKFQGSEEEKVFILLHQMHNKMVRRELLYTAVTRARKHLVIICENTSFEKGVAKQAIKGNTIAEKAEVFKGKLEDIKNDDDLPKLSENLDMDSLVITGEVPSNNLSELPEQEPQLEKQSLDTQQSNLAERPMTMKEKLEAMKNRLRSK